MQRIIIIILVVAIVAAFMVTYVVRFNEVAIKTTFGKADESSKITEPGLGFKIPWVQSVTTYDKRVRFIQSDQETQQTLDKSQILVTTYLTWRVTDPLKFYQRFGGNSTNPREHYRQAEAMLKGRLRSAVGLVSQFPVTDLLSPTPEGSKLAQLEDAMKKALDGAGQSSGAALDEYGIEKLEVGIAGIGLPQDTSKQVFERMKSARLKIANEAVAQGESSAAAIRATAENDAKRITAFATQLAASIRNEGDLEAAAYLREMKQDPQLAVFLENMEFLRKSIGRSATLVIPTSSFGFEAFGPEAARKIQAGQIPTSSSSASNAAANPGMRPAGSATLEGGR